MDASEFAVIVPEHLDAIVRLTAALIGVSDAEDAAQEAIIRAWQAWPTLRDRQAVRTWLLRIAANVCHNWQSGHFGTQRQRNVSLELHTDIAITLEDDDNIPGSSMHIATLDIQTVLALLDANHQTVIALRYFGGFDATEIGAILSLPPSTVRSRINRALTLIRAHLTTTDASVRS